MMRSGTICLPMLLGALLVGLPLWSQDVEEFPVASGPLEFGEQPWIQGNVVVWQRYPGDNPVFDPAMIQSRNIGVPGSPVIRVAPYPPGLVGVLLSETHLFWGTYTVYARPFEDVALGRISPAVEVAHDMVPRAATRAYVFFGGAVEDVSPDVRRGYFAKALADLTNPAPEAVKLVAVLHGSPRMSRMVAASEKYFVWADRDPDVPQEPWKIYAKRTEDLFTPGAEFLALDSKLASGLGIYLDLHDSILVCQAYLDPTKAALAQIYLLDIDKGGEPICLAAFEDRSVHLTWPAVSSEYAVWVGSRDIIKGAWGVRLEDGRPVGESFLISSPGGAWITIDRNIAVWHGAVFVDNTPVESGIIAAELPLPGAQDVGDVNQDGRVNLTDAVIVLDYLFRGGAQPRRRLADVSLSGHIDVMDAVQILQHLFTGEPLPAG